MPGFSSRHRWLARLLTAAWVAAGTAMVALPRPAAAQIGSDRYASIVIDAGSGNILSAVNADEPRYPASLTKMMTLYMLFEALRDRRVTLDQQVPVSSWAASMSPTKLGLLPGSYITVEQSILGLVTKSANDAAAALGELMGGDEERFAQMMTLRARALGMTRTTFRNASGLPDYDQVTTARDMATLAQHIVQDFPAYYRYFSVPSFVFRGRTVLNHQHMLQTYPGADGLKTGYIKDSGYNLVTSALRGDVRLVGVVLGASNGGERDQHMAALLDGGFDRLGAPMVLARRDPAPSRISSLLSAAQAAPYAPPLYSAPYGDGGGRYTAPSYAAPSYAAPPRFYAPQLADARPRPQVIRPRWAEQVVQRMPARPDPRFERTARYERAEPRFARPDRVQTRPVSVMPFGAAPPPLRARPAPARGYEAAPKPVRAATHTAWQSSRYPG